MLKSILLAAASLAASHAPPALAQTITANDTDAIVKVLRDKGFSPQLETGSDGSPTIRAKIDGLNFLVFFNCQGAVNCTSISFLTKVDMERVYPLDKANWWNRKKRFSRIYIQNDDPVLTMDVAFPGDGISSRLFEDNVTVWASLTKQFREHLAE